MKKLFAQKYLWIVILGLFSLISLLGDVWNNRFDMADFEVYYRTAERMFFQQEIYRIESDGHFVYKYAPSAAVFFVPFLVFGFEISKYIFWILLTVALAWGLHIFIKLLSDNQQVTQKEKINSTLFFSILAVVPHIHLEWHLGQVNMLLLVIYLAILKMSMAEKFHWVGGLAGASIFIKPFGLIFLPYWIWKKQFRMVGYFLLAAVVVGVLPFIFYPSFEKLIDLYSAWMNELQIELAAKQNLLADANHTLFSVLARFTPIQFLLTSEVVEKIYQLMILGILGLGFLKYMQWGKNLPKAIIGEFAVLVAWIPLLAFTSQNAFIFTLPLMVYLIFYFEKLPIWGKGLVVVGCIFIGINMYDLVGGAVHQYLMKISIYTFGSVLLLIVAFYWRRMFFFKK